jgi:hypothetical protein
MQHQYGLCYNSNIFKDFGYFNEAWNNTKLILRITTSYALGFSP